VYAVLMVVIANHPWYILLGAQVKLGAWICQCRIVEVHTSSSMFNPDTDRCDGCSLKQAYQIPSPFVTSSQRLSYLS
jgi:hypothetical protein